MSYLLKLLSRLLENRRPVHYEKHGHPHETLCLHR
jgi:hypothetical protein